MSTETDSNDRRRKRLTSTCQKYYNTSQERDIRKKAREEISNMVRGEGGNKGERGEREREGGG